MKKSLKSLALVLVFVMLAIVPVLAGCAKTYTVNVSITGGNQNGGYVTVNGDSAYGKNAVADGDDFKFYIHAFGGYYISEIKVDGEHYSQSFDHYNYEFYLSNVTKDTDIEITFDRDSFTVELYCKKVAPEGIDNGWEEEPYRTYAVPYGEKFMGLLEFGTSTSIFYYIDQETDAAMYINTLYGVNIWSTGKNGAAFKVFTNKTQADLQKLLQD